MSCHLLLGITYQAGSLKSARSARICWISDLCYGNILLDLPPNLILAPLLHVDVFRKRVGRSGKIPPTAISIAPSSQRKGNSHRSIVCITRALFPDGQIDSVPSHPVPSIPSSSSHCPIYGQQPPTMMIPPDKDLLTLCPNSNQPSCLLGQLFTCPEPVNLTSAAVELTKTPLRLH